ncbi:hypothetical protein KM043_011874 [Ampulex compressa]|nr:hypothetical protein KM043_011874 [Ampulex compressa]
MSILAYNGGAIIAMKGKKCVAIAADRRFGIQTRTITCDFQKVFEMGPHLYLSLPGLATDTQTRFGPYFVEPIVAGLDPETFEPFICNMDLLGCRSLPEDFVVGGTCTQQLYVRL